MHFSDTQYLSGT